MSNDTLRQLAMNQFINSNLLVDGIIGPQSMLSQQKICEYFSMALFPESEAFLDFLLESTANNLSKDLSMFAITSFGGKRLPEKLSTFGGPEDKGDRTNGLAFIDTFQAKTPRAIAEAWIARDYPLSNLFRIGHMMQAYVWPVVDGEIMGLSYYLDVNGFYAAMRVPSGLVKQAFRRNHMRVNIYAIKTNTYVSSVPIVDYGPAEWTGRVIDVSPGILNALKIQTDDLVAVAWSR